MVIERGRVGHGSSFGNAGLLAASHCEPLPSPGVVGQGLRYLLQRDGPFYVHLGPDLDLARWLWKFCRFCNEKHLHHAIGILRKLSVESLDLHAELAEQGGAQYEYGRTGLLSLYCDERDFEAKQEYAARMKTYGIESAVFSGDEVREREPEVGPQVVGGLLYRGGWAPRPLGIRCVAGRRSQEEGRPHPYGHRRVLARDESQKGHHGGHHPRGLPSRPDRAGGRSMDSQIDAPFGIAHPHSGRQGVQYDFPASRRLSRAPIVA